MKRVVLALAVVAVLAVTQAVAFQEARAGTLSFFVWLGAPSVALAGVAAVVLRRDGRLGELAAVRAGDFSRGALLAATLFAASWAFTRVVTPPSSLRAAWLARVYTQLGDPAALRERTTLLLAGLAVVAAADELVLRGLVPHLLEPALGTRRALLAATFLAAAAALPVAFVLADPVAGPNPLVPLLALGCGAFWSFAARRYGRLGPGVFSHFLYAWAVTVLLRLFGPSV